MTKLMKTSIHLCKTTIISQTDPFLFVLFVKKYEAQVVFSDVNFFLTLD